MNAIYLEKSQVPRALLGGYTGTKFKAIPCESVTLHDTAWSGGSRSTYRVVELSTQAAAPMPGNPAPRHFGGNMEGQEVTLQPGYAVVCHSIFCGKDMGLTFYVHPADVAKMLPAPVSLSDAERIVLAATAGLISRARKEAIVRNGVSDSDRDTATATLISRGMLTQGRAITTQGRNALGDFRLR